MDMLRSIAILVFYAHKPWPLAIENCTDSTPLVRKLPFGDGMRNPCRRSSSSRASLTPPTPVPEKGGAPLTEAPAETGATAPKSTADRLITLPHSVSAVLCIERTFFILRV